MKTKFLGACVLILINFISLTAKAGDDLAWLVAAEQKSAALVSQLQASELWVGGVVGLYDNGSTSKLTYGKVAPDSDKWISLRDSFEIGSISKSFTGILLALALVEFPELSVDDKLAKVMPGIGNNYVANITLRQLATHTSGLSDGLLKFSSLPNFDPNNPLGNYSDDDLLTYLKAAEPDPKLEDSSHPGQFKRSYSNGGFSLLGLVLSRLYHATYDDLVASKITRPLGMSETFVLRRNSTLPSNFLDAFSVVKNLVHHASMDAFAPAGAIVSTLPDMMKFLEVNLRSANNPETALDHAMQISQRLGLGWDSYSGDDIIWKNGQTYGFASLIAFDPKNQRATVVLSNMYSMLSDWVAALPIQESQTTSDQIYIFKPSIFQKSTIPLTQTERTALVGAYTSKSSSGVDRVILSVRGNSVVFKADSLPPGLILNNGFGSDPYSIYQGLVVLGTINPLRNGRNDIVGFDINVHDASGKVIYTETFTRD